MVITAYITFITDFKKVYLRREVSRISAYGQQYEETICGNKISDKTMTRKKMRYLKTGRKDTGIKRVWK